MIKSLGSGLRITPAFRLEPASNWIQTRVRMHESSLNVHATRTTCLPQVVEASQGLGEGLLQNVYFLRDIYPRVGFGVRRAKENDRSIRNGTALIKKAEFEGLKVLWGW
ncbi:hypothetical protein CDL15_Pgr015122 [Punica granatum]|nr:hypothetical protein CDL15_Pgr015122 [Punica granatum]